MKKIVNICLFLLILNFNINVYAEKEQPEDNGIKVEESQKEDNEENNKGENLDKEESDKKEKSSDATLKEVYINEQKVVCNDYVCEQIIKDNSITDVVITYKTNHDKASVSEKEIKSKLKEGENLFYVEVTAEDETTQKYTFKITKEMLSTDSTLKKLVVNGEEIKLQENTLKYQTSVSHATTKLKIEAIPNSDKASIEDFKNNEISYDFYDETKEIKIKVIAEAGEISTYVITVNKREEQDANLKNLKISNASFEFESGVYDYEVTVLKSVEKLEIEAIPNDLDANIKIDNPTLEIGENTVKIEVDNDGNKKTYTIKVNKLNEEDKNLANLESLTIEGYELEFKADKYEYDLKIGDVNFLVIDAIPKVEDSEVEITGNLDLVDGSIIKIKVNYDAETYNVYRINIIKEIVEEKDNNVSKIIIIVLIVLILIAGIVILIIQIRNKNNKNNKNKDNNQDNSNEIKKDTIEEVKKEDIITFSDSEIDII